MSELTEAAKAEIAAAIRIVREDKFEQFVRSRTPEPPKPPEKDPIFDPNDLPKDPPKDPAVPPPPKDPKDPIKDSEPPKRRSAYWGEIFDD